MTFASADAYFIAAKELEDLLNAELCGGGEGADNGVESEVDGLVSELGVKGAPAVAVAGGVEEVGSGPGEAEGLDKARLGRCIGYDEAKEQIRIHRQSRLKCIGVVLEGNGASQRGSLNFEEYPANVVEVAFHFSDGASAEISLQGFSKGVKP